jgi:hypothetical protein
MVTRHTHLAHTRAVERPRGRSKIIGTIITIQKRYGKNGRSLRTWYFLRPVVIGCVYFDHLWIPANKKLRRKKLKEGDTVHLTGKVSVYHDSRGGERICIKFPYAIHDVKRFEIKRKIDI